MVESNDGEARTLSRGTRVHLEQRGSVAWLRLACPERRNAIDLACARELDLATARCADDPTIHLIVVRASREAFCVGGDIEEFGRNAERIEAHILEITDHFHRAILRLATGRAISIALAEGVAAGAGLGLALACDFLVATTEARFTTAYARLGFSPDGGVSHFLTARLGPRGALRLLALNPIVDASEAAAMGLVTQLSAPDAIDATVDSLVEALQAATPGCLAQSKALVTAAALTPLAEQLDAERAAIARLAATPEAGARIAGFLARPARKPTQ